MKPKSMLPLMLCLLSAMKCTLGHVEPTSSSDSELSNSDENYSIARNEITHRKSYTPRRRRYEGLPIEVPNRSRRRDSDNDMSATDPTTTTTVTTTITGPPLHPRYRRVFSPDEEATIEQHPYMAALLMNQQLWCGAVIIDTDRVLTAAHCLQLQYNNRFFREYVKMLTVRIGSSNATGGGEVLRVSEIFFHPNYKPTTLEFNFAVLKLHKNMSFETTRGEPTVAMIEYSTAKNIPVDNNILFLGWGSVLAQGGVGGKLLLQKVELPIYDTADCQDIYGRELVTRNNFCAGFITKPKNVCNHDAGGPAIMNGKVVGILSFSSKRCDQPDQPAVFSTTGAVADWLEAIGEKKLQLQTTAIKSPEKINT